MEKKWETLFSDISRDFMILISPSFLSNPQIMLSWGLFINKLFILTCLLCKCPPTHTKQNLTVIYIKGSVGSLCSKALPLQ